jgi:paraquat-inducible protein A
MLDVFVVMILVALVQLKELATIQPGLAVAAFGGVVVLTMLAAMAFDPRLLWQPQKDHHV